MKHRKMDVRACQFLTWLALRGPSTVYEFAKELSNITHERMISIRTNTYRIIRLLYERKIVAWNGGKDITPVGLVSWRKSFTLPSWGEVCKRYKYGTEFVEVADKPSTLDVDIIFAAALERRSGVEGLTFLTILKHVSNAYVRKAIGTAFKVTTKFLYDVEFKEEQLSEKLVKVVMKPVELKEVEVDVEIDILKALNTLPHYFKLLETFDLPLLLLIRNPPSWKDLALEYVEMLITRIYDVSKKTFIIKALGKGVFSDEVEEIIRKKLVIKF